jgi:ERCC4-type nuclease
LFPEIIIRKIRKREIETGDVKVNRQQRRQAERQAKKDHKQFRRVLEDPKERTKNEAVIRSTWMDAQVYNNHEWAVRLERIKEVKGIGEKTMDKIFKALEEPLTPAERSKARQTYESGVDQVDFRN